MSIATDMRIQALERTVKELREQGEKDRRLVNGLTQQCVDLAHVVDQLQKAQEQRRATLTRSGTR